MKFRKSSNYHLVSECGEYSIAKVVVDGTVGYEAWHMPKGTSQQIALAGREESSLACIGTCRRHAEQEQARKSA